MVMTLIGLLNPPVKYFQLKKKRKNTTMRAELLQKFTETSQKLKRSVGGALPHQRLGTDLEDGLHNPTQRHPVAGALPEPHGSQCL